MIHRVETKNAGSRAVFDAVYVLFLEEWEADADVDADIGEEKRIAITFDDGPHRLYTPKLLDGLKERGIHATFFLVGENIGNNEALVKRMAEEGHLIGNHTFSHVQLTKMKKEDACWEVQQTNERICAVTGAPVLYIRPPYGSWNRKRRRAVSFSCMIFLIRLWRQRFGLWMILPRRDIPL